MEIWWSTLTGFEKILWSIALFFSLLFLVQTVLSFIGGDADLASGDPDDAIDQDQGTGSSFFTIKNFIAFFTMFGWVGLAGLHNGLGQAATISIAVLAGAAMVFLMVWLLAKADRLKHSGTLDLKNAVGCTGNTYLLVPAARGGLGKVHVRVQGALRELDAMTDDASAIATGSIVKVTAVIDGRILLITRTN